MYIYAKYVKHIRKSIFFLNCIEPYHKHDVEDMQHALEKVDAAAVGVARLARLHLLLLRQQRARLLLLISHDASTCCLLSPPSLHPQ